MRLDDGPTDCQADAHAFRLGGDEGLKQPLADFGREAWSSIGDVARNHLESPASAVILGTPISKEAVSRHQARRHIIQKASTATSNGYIRPALAGGNTSFTRAP